MSKQAQKKRKTKCWPEPRYVVALNATTTNAQRVPVFRFFVDGSCSTYENTNSDERAAGFGVYCEETGREYCEPLAVPCTHNRAELQAVVFVLDELLRADDDTLLRNFGINANEASEVRIMGDSQYVLKIVTEWLEKWRANNYCKADGSEVLNVDLVMKLDNLLQKFAERRWSLSVQWVRAHLAEPKTHVKESEEWRMWHGNKVADRLALAGSAKHANSGTEKATDPT